MWSLDLGLEEKNWLMRFPFEVEGRLSPAFSDDGMAEEVEKGFASLRGMSPCIEALKM
jgi:hypothetical protein